MKIEFDKSFKESGFANDFLGKFLKNGFGTLPKVEIELVVFESLIQNHAWGENPSDFDLATKLGISVSRVRNMKDKLQRRNPLSEEDAKEKLREIIANSDQLYENSTDQSRGIVKLEIENGYLLDFAKSLIKQRGGISDTSFNRSIVTMSAHVFVSLVDELLSQKEKKQVIEKFNKQLPDKTSKLYSLKKATKSYMETIGKVATFKLVGMCIDDLKIFITENLI